MNGTNLEELLTTAMRSALRYREALGADGHRPKMAYHESRTAFREPTPEHGAMVSRSSRISSPEQSPASRPWPAHVSSAG